MSGKTQKIDAELHKKLKLLALHEGKTLQQLTEEIIRDAIKERDNEGNQGVTAKNEAE